MAILKKTSAVLKKELQNMANPPSVLIEGDNNVTVKVKTNKGEEDKIVSFEEARLPFNRRFNIRPAAIVFCTTTEQVAHIVSIAKKNPDFPLRTRSTGHDHEAESTGTGAIVIDFSLMKTFDIAPDKSKIRIDSGVQFKDAIDDMDTAGISIPHGTCETVGVMGFTLGGGWGPWTRLHGMCCERLLEATIVLGDGTIKKLKKGEGTQEDKELFWALRGGGGFSYGILTELVIEPFKQPNETLRFTVSWEESDIPPAIEILKVWEEVIAPGKNIKLIGTNLKMMAIADKEVKNETKEEEIAKIDASVHKCSMYGYYGGEEKSTKELKVDLKKDVDEWFKNVPGYELTSITTEEAREKEKKGGGYSFSTWDRISTAHAILKAAPKKRGLGGNIPMLGHFPPDIDDAAPHKISSRLVEKTGLGKEGRRNLIRTLRSTLIHEEGITAHVHTYVTLGAISGNFYDENYVKKNFPDGVSFPFTDRPYTIQYQVWWNEKYTDAKANEYANQALDWIQTARDFDFPQTRGSFISFKDASIPTKDYFLESYDNLKRIKKKYSNDPNNLFRTRKTIY